MTMSKVVTVTVTVTVAPVLSCPVLSLSHSHFSIVPSFDLI
jgi:hypothetical protein